MSIVQSAAVSILLLHGLCLVPAIIWGRQLWLSDWKRPTLNQGIVLISSAVLFCATAVLLYQFVGDHLLNSHNTVELLMRLGYKPSILFSLGIYFVLVNSTLEELFWRGVVFNKLTQLRPDQKSFAWIWSSVSYGLYHYSILRLVLFPGWAEFGVLFLAGFGALLAYIYRKTGSIILVSLYHAFLTDLAAICLIIALFYRLQIPSLL
jgi:membrane protease YdiL (CAAX protease family)